MYQMFKDCLLAPKKIYTYMAEKRWKLIIYFLLISVIYSLPSFVTLANPRDLSSESLESVVNIFEGANRIEYEIIKVDESYELQPTNNNTLGQYISLQVVNGVDSINTLIIFDSTTESIRLENYNINNNILDNLNLVVHMAKENIYIYSGSNFDKPSTSGGGVIGLSNENNSLYNISYVELGMTNIDFSVAKDNATLFTKQLNNVYQAIYHKHLSLILGFGIPMVFIGNLMSLLLEMVMLAFVIKLLYRSYGLKFTEIYKIVIFAYTPRVVFNLLSIFWASSLMYFLGQLLSIIYILMAMKSCLINNLVKNLDENIKKMIEK